MTALSRWISRQSSNIKQRQKKLLDVVGDPCLHFWNSLYMAMACCRDQKLSEGAQYYKTVIREHKQMCRHPEACITSLANISENLGNQIRFARLMGACEGKYQIPVFDKNGFIFEWRIRAGERIKRGPEFLAEWEKGKAMSLDEAAEYALEDDDLADA